MGDKKNKRQTGTVKSPKIPKRIAGVKLPKELRKSGNLLLETASRSVGREILVSGLMAVIAGAAARRPAAASPTQPVAPPAPASTIDPQEAGARAARQVIDMIGGAATAALARYREEMRDPEAPKRRD